MMFERIKEWWKWRRLPFTKKQLASALYTLRCHAGTSGVPKPFAGICANAWYYLVTEHGIKATEEGHTALLDLLCGDLFLDWPYHRGDKYWPVPRPVLHREGKWQGHSLAFRDDLITHVLNKLKHELA